MPGKQCDSISLPATNGITNFVRLEAYSNLRYKDICGGNGTSRFKRFNFRRATGNFGLPVVAPMNLMKSNPVDTYFPVLKGVKYRLALFLLSLAFCWFGPVGNLLVAAPSTDSAAVPWAMTAPASPGFNVTSYVVHGGPPLSTNRLATLFGSYTGTNVSVAQLVSAAAGLHQEYVRQGEPRMSVAIPLRGISDGIVTMNVFPTAVPQVLVSGQTYIKFTTPPEITLPEMAASPEVTNSAAEKAPASLANNPARLALSLPLKPSTPEQLAQARAQLLHQMAEQAAAAADTRVHVVETNSGPRFEVKHYDIIGNTVLPPATLARSVTNIDGDFGTNVSFGGIHAAVTELQKAYRLRGYVTVSVGLPQQKLTNATVKIQVTEGRLEAINVKGNHYFSSNNVMSVLPSLHTNIILNAQILQAELNRANGNHNRQIYPVIGPGPDPGTSELTLKVKDELPLHAKVELNNESSPGTPDLRVNTSAVYENLWQSENALGLQYSFSPEQYKSTSPYAEQAYAKQGPNNPYSQQYNSANRWNFYDLPTVANYSTFYRLPLGAPVAIGDEMASQPGSFGYDEATRKFNLPSPSGQPDLTFFASRSTIDGGLVTTTPDTFLFFNPSNNTSLVQRTVQQDLTVNNDAGFRLNIPLPAKDDFNSSVSGGLDLKNYQLTSFAINGFTDFAGEIDNVNGSAITNPIVSQSFIPVPTTVNRLNYLPLALRYDANLQDAWGLTTWGLGLSANTWYSASTTTSTGSSLSGRQSLQTMTGSAQSTGYWVILNPSFSQEFSIHTNWILTARADGQWASEPLISNEEFGIGGVNSVRGYHEGDVFGDNGWHVSLDQKTPPALIGMVDGTLPLVVSGTVYMDYARSMLIDPRGRPAGTSLWSTGFGAVASIGSHWESRFLFSLPLLDSPDESKYHPFFNFSLTAQF
jgi:hemolysin activation/secretion protein